MHRLAVAALAALLATGCAVKGRKFYFTPVAEVAVINDCRGAATLIVESIDEVVARLGYGERGRVILPRPYGGSDGQMILTVRGQSITGIYLGSDSRTFYVYDRSRQEVWQVRYLTGGAGCRR
ncbi:MAG: hypothetical protein A3J09_02535 [Candidatus Zambryskibacteria bacterium RIFCSPLOWO2_02_FULL_51_21]|uniref:Lipoprotein n=1 Tax=Candidatus Zambryskibacteria bacterium RIFCSPHIGHO2_02_FULL_43_37 TaxID=1802749 RepID=A0A1G2TGB7_9BACT|nr:MAG: hypothetical protein A2723_02525 [Candidatus Zambryskibacteria bacterium RIFCSPHIGHO2_01_FULL_52_18]OHA96335.1 MAG: hypothetical protein A3D49_00365 [Candidatus Zambryskibacteria bacterium RIFCSPHIGHO2_02_FULL_43_37]OHB07738.1 MAG: hypothetical protein A2944_00240 [Candidatus Zambryskibacteria bacterium RIFCSPLOWO2_01_FULL_52_12]OHB11405.1 MAG: hypothetical protein A3J09_02535 [Candidatus Zambryskibacteria bacterium RIFCSPLOWO2_02_FULL_51_21]